MGKSSNLRKRLEADQHYARGRALMYFNNTFVGWPRKTGLVKVKMTREDLNDTRVVDELHRWVDTIGSAYGVRCLLWIDGAYYGKVTE